MMPHTDSITLVHQPPFSIEVFQSTAIQEPVLITNVLNHLHSILPNFFSQLKQECSSDHSLTLCHKMLDCKVWNIELSFINNAEMMTLNHNYRAKAEPTDVLSFGVFADDSSIETETSSMPSALDMLTQLPEVTLGNIFVSIPYAIEHCSEETMSSEQYLLERILHGCLHLLGIHHETMEAYERVRRIQNSCITQLHQE